jgi:hypothetical protein
MKTYWLRGALLGISLAALLAGGTALAKEFTVTADQDCIECWPETCPPEEYALTITVSGLDPDLRLHYRHTYGSCDPGEGWREPPLTDPWYATYAYYCQCDCCEGLWTLEYWQEDQGTILRYDSVTVTAAEDCEALEEEFVPESGTIVLLGSGLAGLAGYATLRLRSGQALRWRSRE